MFLEMSSTPESQTPARGFQQTCVSTTSQDSGCLPPFLLAVSPRDQKVCAMSLRGEHLILEAADKWTHPFSSLPAPLMRFISFAKVQWHSILCALTCTGILSPLFWNPVRRSCDIWLALSLASSGCDCLVFHNLCSLSTAQVSGGCPTVYVGHLSHVLAVATQLSCVEP